MSINFSDGLCGIRRIFSRLVEGALLNFFAYEDSSTFLPYVYLHELFCSIGIRVCVSACESFSMLDEKRRKRTVSTMRKNFIHFHPTPTAFQKYRGKRVVQLQQAGQYDTNRFHSLPTTSKKESVFMTLPFFENRETSSSCARVSVLLLIFSKLQPPTGPGKRLRK